MILARYCSYQRFLMDWKPLVYGGELESGFLTARLVSGLRLGAGR
jgi:hypothetical protein